MNKCLNVILCNEEKKTQTNKTLGRSHQHLCWITSVTLPHHGIHRREHELWLHMWPWMTQDIIISPKRKPQKDLFIVVHFGKGQTRLLKIHWEMKETPNSCHTDQLVAPLRMTLEGKRVFRGMATPLSSWAGSFLFELYVCVLLCICYFLIKIFLSGKGFGVGSD